MEGTASGAATPDTWIEYHVRATAGGDAVRAVLDANRGLIFGEVWHADPLEMFECTRRLVAACAAPKWPGEHTNALGRELIRLREDAAAAARPDPSRDEYTAPPACACGGTGLVVVPHPRCVWNGKVVLDRAHNRVLTCAVLCDAAGCDAGRAARHRETESARDQKRPTLAAYHRQVGLRDAPAALAAVEREAAARVRRECGPGPSDAVFASLRAKVKAGSGAA